MNNSRRPPLVNARVAVNRPINVLLVGPYDPHCGEFTFLAPPLGVWRLKGYLDDRGQYAQVFDPNNCRSDPEAEFRDVLAARQWDIVGFSTTGMTLKYDLSLSSIARRILPESLLVAGGMEATFAPELVSRLGGFDLIVLGEGEKPLAEAARRLQRGEPLFGVESTAVPLVDGQVHRIHGHALNREEYRDAAMRTPHEQMPYADYWRRLESAYAVDALTEKAAREARLAEIRSVRIATLNYCPMACTFCSSTNFLHEVQGKVAKVTRLDAEECLSMVDRAIAAQPAVKTIIWQDDIFVFNNDKRIEPLCEGIIAGKVAGRFPEHLGFISTNRIDAMDGNRLALMKRAGFRVLGFGVESFSRNVLREFNKAQIFRHIDSNLDAAVRLGLKPFLDLIMTSPRGSVADIHTTVTRALYWIGRGCEVGLYPYIIPFSGSAMSRDPELVPHTVGTAVQVPGTNIVWQQPQKILPIDVRARRTIQRIERQFEQRIAKLAAGAAHLPSRVRSLIWIESALPLLAKQGFDVPNAESVTAKIEEGIAPRRRAAARRRVCSAASVLAPAGA
jgi:radical SAM superfamily enzyme YgiQ (UPF0313 family)